MLNRTSFEMLIDRVKACKKCPRMEHRNKVLGSQCGSLTSKIVFVGEAPGRLGADVTGVPLSGDQTGYNFEEFIRSIGWSRNDFFITNAVLCNPRDASGNNHKPKDSELKNCSTYLQEVLHIIQPKVIVTLGTKALKALDYIVKHNIVLKHHVARPVEWNSYKVFPLYHPSPQALIHRKKELQFGDYMQLNHYVKMICT